MHLTSPISDPTPKFFMWGPLLLENKGEGVTHIKNLGVPWGPLHSLCGYIFMCFFRFLFLRVWGSEIGGYEGSPYNRCAAKMFTPSTKSLMPDGVASCPRCAAPLEWPALLQMARRLSSGSSKKKRKKKVAEEPLGRAVLTPPQGMRENGVFVFRVRPSGKEWQTGRKPKTKTIGRKIENGPRPERGKMWYKNGETNCQWDWGQFLIFFRRVDFSASFSPFSAVGPFSILCQAARLAIYVFFRLGDECANRQSPNLLLLQKLTRGVTKTSSRMYFLDQFQDQARLRRKSSEADVQTRKGQTKIKNQGPVAVWS